MTFIIHPESHLDHGLNGAHFAHILELFRERHEFFIETIELPKHLMLLPCSLFGPIMGEPPIDEEEVVYRARGDRPYQSRLLIGNRPRLKSKMTVVAGPHKDFDTLTIILYTAYGGPAAPREPGDQSLSVAERDEASAFWNEHALAEFDK